jgi:hypothetical protein
MPTGLVFEGERAGAGFPEEEKQWLRVSMCRPVELFMPTASGTLKSIWSHRNCMTPPINPFWVTMSECITRIR